LFVLSKFQKQQKILAIDPQPDQSLAPRAYGLQLAILLWCSFQIQNNGQKTPKRMARALLAT